MRSFFSLFLETKRKESGLNCISTPVAGGRYFAAIPALITTPHHLFIISFVPSPGIRCIRLPCIIPQHIGPSMPFKHLIMFYCILHNLSVYRQLPNLTWAHCTSPRSLCVFISASFTRLLCLLPCTAPISQSGRISWSVTISLALGMQFARSWVACV